MVEKSTRYEIHVKNKETPVSSPLEFNEGVNQKNGSAEMNI